MGNMEGHFMFSLLVLAVLGLGIVGVSQQDAYAGNGGPEDLTIWCNTDGSIERPGNFWTEGDCEIIVNDLDIDDEFEVEIHGDLDLFGEGRCRDAAIELTIHIDDNGLEGTITIESEGESCRDRETREVNGEHEFIITGSTGDFSFITGGSGDLFTTMDRDRNFDLDIHGDLEVDIPDNQVVEVHCEVEYDWNKFIIFGERDGEGECVYTFADGTEQEEEVQISGGFIQFSGTIFGEFNIMDYEGNDIYLDEEGTIEVDCEFEGSDEPPRRHRPYCLETDMTVTGGSGLFDDLNGEGNRTATGFFKTFFIFSSGQAFSTIWIFFDCPECVPEVEEVESNGSGCDNCEPPTLGLNKSGDQRMVDGGFTCNGQTADVENYYTEFPTITGVVGQPLLCMFVIYEDTYADNIRHFEFAIGKRVDDYMSDVQGKIVWDRDFKLVETVTYDTEMFRDVSVEALGNTKCRDESSSKQCLLLYLKATPTQPLVNEIIVKTNVWDENRNAKQNFYNDGIDIVGDTENALPSFNVVDGRNGITTIYTTDFTLEDQTHAVDKYGNTWTLINNIWDKDYVAADMSCSVSSYIGYDRTCPEFTVLKQGQILLAEQYFDSSNIQSEPTGYFTYEYTERLDNRLIGTLLG